MAVEDVEGVDGADGCRFGAQAAWAEDYGLPAEAECFGNFGGGEVAFGADEYCCGLHGAVGAGEVDARGLVVAISHEALHPVEAGDDV